MKSKRGLVYLLIFFTLLAVILSCNLPGDLAEEESYAAEEPQPIDSEATSFPEEAQIIEEPGGASLAIDAGALSDGADAAIEEIGEGVPFGGGGPFNAASAEYSVDLGGEDQIGAITMTVPLYGVNKDAAPDSASDANVYLTWTEPTGGTPSVVGTIVEEGLATFPVVGQGKYQVFSIPSHAALLELTSLFEPLAVPTYPQMTPAWCSPTAMTNVVNFHQGGWPVGGFGSVWGESSNWFLAGKAGQPFDSGYFFHWLLDAGGFPAPSNVKQSFSTSDAEVIIWNWKIVALYGYFFSDNFVNKYANELFDAYQAYVEHYVWGIESPRRPVAWGSSLAGHSRTITGSNGAEYYYNDPSSGSLNSSKSWADYRQTVLDSINGEKIEVIDTVVFFADPQPAAERRGVIWLLPSDDKGFPGSVALIDGDTGLPATHWVWDGDMGHEKGYYYEDLRGVLPTDPVFDSQFKTMDYLDEVEYGFAVMNISKSAYDYHVDVVLQNENFSVLENVGMFDMSAGPGERVDMFPAGSFRLYDLPPGLFTLKFVLLQNGVYQDVKYVQFRAADSDLLIIDPHLVLTKNAFCRKGPSTDFEDVTAFVAGTKLGLVGVNAERTWGKVEATVNEMTFQCWVALSTAEISGEDDVPVLADQPRPTPTEEPTGPVCVNTLDSEACVAAGGTYILGLAGAPYCQCPDE